MKSILKKIGCCLLLVIFFSCWKPPSEITDEISGTYSFEFSRGDYELLKILNDSSFIQEFYLNKESFRNDTSPFYINKGKWSIQEDNGLRFNHWLEYCYLRNPDSILPHPKPVDMGDVFWNKPTRNNNSYITVFDDTGYYFVKMEENEINNKK